MPGWKGKSEDVGRAAASISPGKEADDAGAGPSSSRVMITRCRTAGEYTDMGLQVRALGRIEIGGCEANAGAAGWLVCTPQALLRDTVQSGTRGLHRRVILRRLPSSSSPHHAGWDGLRLLSILWRSFGLLSAVRKAAPLGPVAVHAKDLSMCLRWRCSCCGYRPLVSGRDLRCLF
jgi:hypothetical protein